MYSVLLRVLSIRSSPQLILQLQNLSKYRRNQSPIHKTDLSRIKRLKIQAKSQQPNIDYQIKYQLMKLLQ